MRLVIGLVAAVLACSCSDDDTSSMAGDGGAAGSPGAGTSGGAGDSGAGGSPGTDCPAPTYAFDSRFDPGTSSVSHTGQAWRHVAILDLKKEIGGLTEAIEKDELAPAEGVIVPMLDFYFRFNPDNGNTPLGLSLDKAPLAESTYDDISTGKDLVGKLAGNDDKTDHRNFDGEDDSPDDDVVWEGDSELIGWPGASSPEDLVDSWFATLEQNAIAHADSPRKGPGDVDIPVYITEDGQDLQQLVQKFLTGAIAYAQGTDDYLDDDVAGKGLLAAHQQDDDSPYTSLEHVWDEGFGYFGSPWDYDTYTDEEIAGNEERPEYAESSHDVDCDGEISVHGEMVFGHSANAGKRDLGAQVATDFTKDAFDAFVAGRQIIRDAELTDQLEGATLEALKAERDKAVAAWENAIAATVVHYINDTLGDLDAVGSGDFDYLAYSKHWSELKGFALSLQFNPRAKLDVTELETLHGHIGIAPVAPDGDVAAYRSELLDARALLGDAYGFNAENLENW